MGKKLFAFNFDCGRMGSLDGRFVLDDEGQKQLEQLYGKELYFGEVLGKHSEVYGELERKDITVITDNDEFLSMAERLGIDLDSGFNPLDYYDDEEEDDEDDEDEDDE